MARLPPIDIAEQRYVYDYRLPIDGFEYRYRLRYFSRLERWVLDFGTSTEWILKGELAAVDTPLLWFLRDTRLPRGVLMLGDRSNSFQECDFEALSTRCRLYFIPAAKYESAEVSPVLTVTRVV